MNLPFVITSPAAPGVVIQLDGCGRHDIRSRLFFRAKIDQTLKAVDALDDHVQPVVESEPAFVASPDEHRFGVVRRVMIVAERRDRNKAERHRFDEFDEKSVRSDIGDDCGKRSLLLFAQFALEELQQFDLHALTLGFSTVDFREAQVFAQTFHTSEIVARLGLSGVAFVFAEVEIKYAMHHQVRVSPDR
jgi:hypothetical protein